MGKEVSFGDIICPSGITEKFSNLFYEEYNDDGHLIAVSRETFHHDEDDLKFDYKYVVEIEDMRAAVGEDEAPEENMIAHLYLMPTPASLCKKVQESILSNFDSDDISLIGYMDMIYEGAIGVIMGSELWHSDEEFYDVTNDPKCVEVLGTIATVLNFVDSMCGFYLDRYWNMIGSTGWDTLEHAIHGSDWLQPAMDRYEAAMAACKE